MTAAACPAVFFMDTETCITFWQNVAIIDSRGLIDVEHMLTIERAYRTLASRFAGGIVSLVVVQPGTPVSPPDALKESARFIRELGRSLVRIAVVIEDVGVAAQVFRTVVRGINVVNRDSKLAVFGDLPHAVDCILPFIVSATEKMDVTQAMSAVLHTARSRFASTPPGPLAERRRSWPALRS